MANVDGDPQLEVIGNVASGEVQVREADGHVKTTLDPAPATGEHADKSRVLNLFEHPIAADLDGAPGVEVLKGGLTLNGLVNLGVAVGQNLPYNHVLQAWDSATGSALPPSRRPSRTTSCSPARPSPTSAAAPSARRSSAPASTCCARSPPRAPSRRASRSSPAAGSTPCPPRATWTATASSTSRPSPARAARSCGRPTARPGRQRRVVDLAPRRALHRRPRHRRAPARHRARPHRDVQGRQGAARLDAAGRRLAVRHPGALRDPQRGRRGRRERHRREHRRRARQEGRSLHDRLRGRGGTGPPAQFPPVR